MKFYLNKIVLSIFFFGVVNTNAFSINSGHMLDSFELIEDKIIPLLAFKGFFEPSQFLNIKINTDIKKTKTTITIPNSYINNFLLRIGEVSSFADDSILQKLSLNEDLTRKENGEILSKVIIRISTKDKHFLEFDTENSNTRQLTFSIKNIKKKLITVFDEESIQVPQKDENNYEVLKEKHHKTILLHPITALMSYRKFDQIKISVLNASNIKGAANRLAAMIDRKQRKNIEKRIGMNLKIVNISSINQKTILNRTKIYFHPNFLRPALVLAEFLPGEQLLEPFPENRKRKNTNDLQIVVGENFD